MTVGSRGWVIDLLAGPFVGVPNDDKGAAAGSSRNRPAPWTWPSR